MLRFSSINVALPFLPEHEIPKKVAQQQGVVGGRACVVYVGVWVYVWGVGVGVGGYLHHGGSAACTWDSVPGRLVWCQPPCPFPCACCPCTPPFPDAAEQGSPCL